MTSQAVLPRPRYEGKMRLQTLPAVWAGRGFSAAGEEHGRRPQPRAVLATQARRAGPEPEQLPAWRLRQREPKLLGLGGGVLDTVNKDAIMGSPARRLGRNPRWKRGSGLRGRDDGGGGGMRAREAGRGGRNGGGGLRCGAGGVAWLGRPSP